MLSLIEKNKITFFYMASVAFVLFTAYCICRELYWLPFIFPLAIIYIYFYITSFDKLLLFAVLLTPLSINIRESGFGISIPTEPILFSILILFVLKAFFEKSYDRKILTHPVSIAIFFNLFWILITSLTSQIPLVSFKFLLSRLWFIIPVFFVGVLLFKKVKNIKAFLWLYTLSMAIVIVYTIFNHAIHGFDKDAVDWVMQPFFNDHTAYGAALALFIPVIISLSFIPKQSKLLKITSIAISLLFISALFLSDSRAAWVSLIVAAFVFVIVLLKIKFRWIAFATIALISLFFVFRFQITEVLERNEQDSSTNITEQIQSIYNISTDASNLERINRWQSALRMYKAKPVFGFGPGTYQFQYAPYQMSREKTIISTNSGDLGNAHSEYFGPLSESGLLGMLTFLFIVIATFIIGLRVYKRAQSKTVKYISIGTIIGLTTYFTHGVLNNFLDTDKLSVPFWGFLAIIVAIDLYHSKKQIETK